MAFHLRDGWFFDRETDGSVKVCKLESANPNAKVLAQDIFSHDEWVSLVASMSHGQGQREDFANAEILHAGRGKAHEALRDASNRVLELEQKFNEMRRARDSVWTERENLAAEVDDLLSKIAVLEGAIAKEPPAPEKKSGAEKL